jgi:hypothetical protein
MRDEATVALTEAVATLDNAARSAKRAEQAARRQARDIRRTIAAIHESCKELGIELHIDTGRRPQS